MVCFLMGDVIVWVIDLPQVSEVGERVKYLVANKVADDQFRAVPLTCIAGLGQGISEYMERSTQPLASDSCERFALRDGVIESARSTVVLLSIMPSLAFRS